MSNDVAKTDNKVNEEMALSRKVYDFILNASESFYFDDVCKSLSIDYKNTKDRTNISVILHRLCNSKKERIIEKDRKITGKYRKVQDDMVEMDLHGAVESKGLDIRYPFGLERVFKTLPRSVLVCAGASNSGKTAYMLNFCLLNQWKHHVVYFSSEMGASRLKGRLNKHPDFIREGIGFQAFEKGGNFADAVGKFPESLCVIDYLEIYENFYEIGQKIKDIFDQLQGNGVVFIAVQKNPSRKNGKGQTEYVDLGRGGNFGLEKASLYIAMDSAGQDGYSRMKIVKAKEWQQDNVNPNNMEFQYKLLSGCRFVNIQYPVGMPLEVKAAELPF